MLERGFRLSCNGGEEDGPNTSMYLTHRDDRGREFLAGRMQGKMLTPQRLDAIYAKHLQNSNSVFLFATKINPQRIYSAIPDSHESGKSPGDYKMEKKRFNSISKISMETPRSKLSLSLSSGLLGLQTMTKRFKIKDKL
jgi:predicted Zn-dependent peptidase